MIQLRTKFECVEVNFIFESNLVYRTKKASLENQFDVYHVFHPLEVRSWIFDHDLSAPFVS